MRTEQASSSCVRLDMVGAKTLRRLLQFCYTGHASIPRKDVHSGAALLKAAHALDMPSLFLFAERALTLAVTPGTAPALYDACSWGCCCCCRRRGVHTPCLSAPGWSLRMNAMLATCAGHVPRHCSHHSTKQMCRRRTLLRSGLTCFSRRWTSRLLREGLWRIRYHRG